MSLKDDLFHSQNVLKLNSELLLAVSQFDDAADNADAIAFNVIVTAGKPLTNGCERAPITGLDGQSLRGVFMRYAVAHRHYAVDATLEGIKNLADDPRVVSIKQTEQLSINPPKMKFR